MSERFWPQAFAIARRDLDQRKRIRHVVKTGASAVLRNRHAHEAQFAHFAENSLRHRLLLRPLAAMGRKTAPRKLGGGLTDHLLLLSQNHADLPASNPSPDKLPPAARQGLKDGRMCQVHHKSGRSLRRPRRSCAH